TSAVDHVIQPALQQSQQVRAGVTGLAARLDKVAAHLVFAHVKNKRQLLLFVKLNAVVAAAPRPELLVLAMIAGWVRPFFQDFCIFWARNQHLAKAALDLRFWPMI